MRHTREFTADGWRVRLDLSRQVLRLEVPEAVVGRRRGSPPLSPILPRPEGGPVSAATLLLKAKMFDDRLVAAVEVGAQRGAGRFAGKAALLRSLAATLAGGLPGTGGGAATAIHAACGLGGVCVLVPDAVAGAVRAAMADFLGDEGQSKPLGFYAGKPELAAIFRQDRFLQRPLDPATAGELADALRQTPGATDAHGTWLRLNAGLTNPPKWPGLRDAGTLPPFLPPSRTHEVTLFERLYEDRPIPEGFDLMDELIRRVRAGDVSLEPADDAGWYDYLTWSLEPLVVPDRMPERVRLELGKRYRKHLEDLFRGAMALVRETHVKQAGGGYGGYGGSPGPRPIWVNPDLTVEPLPSLYARRAACYRFVRSVLEDAFGADAVDQLRAASEDLARMEHLFAGAATTAGRELGIPNGGEDATVGSFAEWREALDTDPDVSRDARMMVPVFYDVERKKTKVWALLGWRTTVVEVEYRVPPAVLAVEPSPVGRSSTARPPVLFGEDRYEFAVPVTAEVHVSRLLDQDEFRRHCDRHRTREAILANLT